MPGKDYDGGWRSLPPSPKQEDYLIIHGLPVPETRGEANHVIYEHWKAERAKKAADDPDTPKQTDG